MTSLERIKKAANSIYHRVLSTMTTTSRALSFKAHASESKTKMSQQGGREVDLSVLPLQDLLKIQTQFQEVSKRGEKGMVFFNNYLFHNTL
jgi:hypothetical protein